jgi:hypothetical protein
MTQKNFNLFSWTIFLISVAIPFVVWGNNINWELRSITIYQWFPLFGLLAWMIMWTHYITGAIRVKSPELSKPKFYQPVTAYVVLASLLLHPGLLIYAQWDNGAGLPPQSYLDYVGESLQIAVMLGTIGLVIFLSFEFFDRLRTNKYIARYWTAVSISQTIAMTLIFIHGLRLGSNLSSGWFIYVWLAYGIALIPCFYIAHTQDFRK